MLEQDFKCCFGVLTKNVLPKLKKMTTEQKEKINTAILETGLITVQAPAPVVIEPKPVEVHIRKTFEVDRLQKYDVVFVTTPGSCVTPHYSVIFKIWNGYVYSINITSEQKSFAPFEIKKSRPFKGGWFVSHITVTPIEEAKKKFCMTFDAKKEFDGVVETIAEYYKNIFNI